MTWGSRFNSVRATIVRGGIAAALAFTVFMGLPAGHALANSKYASMVMDSYSGDVLFSRNADRRRYPASLTKVMTLYMLFDALEKGSIKLDDELKVSRRAARQPPSKLGVKAGQTITVRTAIKALVVKSANDVAVVVAEALGRSERHFAGMMTQKARSLGMTRTRFRNASGLPNRSQVTTARDMAKMARKIYQHFPQYFHFFKTTEFRWRGRRYTGHNRVLERYNGADGLKTGYTRASGFNLITTAERNGARLIGVVLGGRTSYRRDREMRRILNLTFGRIRTKPAYAKYGRRYLAAVPVLKPANLARAGGAEPEPKPAVAVAGFDIAPRLKPTDAEAIQMAAAQEQKAAQEAKQDETDEPGLMAAAAAEPKSDGLRLTIASLIESADEGIGEGDAAVNTGGPGDGDAGAGARVFGIQIGAFLGLATATRSLNEAIVLAPEVLNRHVAAIIPVDSPNGKVFRARFGPFSEEDADLACGLLEAKGLNCFTITENDWGTAVRP